MKTKALIAALALVLPVLSLNAQDVRERQNRGQGRPRPVQPVIAALDANEDGVIDASEIKNAVAALMKLDKNKDGKLTQDELRPPRPPGGREGRRQGGRPGGDQAPRRRGPAND